MKILFLLILFGCGTSEYHQNSNSTSSEFKLRQYKEKSLSNGLKVLFVEDHSLPYLSLELLVQSGSSQDPISQSGVAHFVARLLNKGTKTKKSFQLSHEIDQMGAQWEASVSSDYTRLSLNGLSHTQDKMISLFSEMITQPSFEDTEINRERKKILSDIKNEVDVPTQFATRNFMTYLYGAHPYSRSSLGLPRDVQAIKKRDIARFFLKYYRPTHALLAVSGHYTPQIEDQLEEYFGQWKARDVEPLTFPDISDIKGVQILLVDKPDLVQTQIRVGHKGIQRSDPNYLTLRLANTILGGAYVSRLNNRIRKDLGLTYWINSQFEARSDKGPFLVSTFTRNDKAGEAINETLSILSAFAEKGVTQEELDEAKGLLRGQFPQIIETSEKLGSNLLILRIYGIKDNYLSSFMENLNKITVAEVNRVVKEYFYPKNLKIFVYSSSKDVLPQIRPIGIVEVKSYKEFL